MSTLTDWLAATFYVSDADVQTHADVAAAQQAEIDRQYSEGKRNVSDYLSLSDEIQTAGSERVDYKRANSGVWGFMKALPWWFWIIVILVPFGYLGGFAWLAKRSRNALNQ
jgi:hypothetical protein